MVTNRLLWTRVVAVTAYITFGSTSLREKRQQDWRAITFFTKFLPNYHQKRWIDGIKSTKRILCKRIMAEMITRNADDNTGTLNRHGPSMNATTDQQWRRYGEARRKSLVVNDAWFGSSFRLNRKCRAEKYFELAERVRSIELILSYRSVNLDEV